MKVWELNSCRKLFKLNCTHDSNKVKKTYIQICMLFNCNMCINNT